MLPCHRRCAGLGTGRRLRHGSIQPPTPCPAGTDEHTISKLAFCVPQSNQRYRFTPKGIEPMYWLGEEPIAPPTDSQTLKDADVTIARAWADHSSGRRLRSGERQERV